jgi:hypothetical protein
MQSTAVRQTFYRRLATLAVAASTISCGGDTLVALTASDRNRRVGAHVGDRIEITLQTIGSGEYASPPAISSPALSFLDVAGCGESIPSGGTQCFHFRAAQPGTAVVTFTHTDQNPPVQDTVDVR